MDHKETYDMEELNNINKLSMLSFNKLKYYNDLSGYWVADFEGNNIEDLMTYLEQLHEYLVLLIKYITAKNIYSDEYVAKLGIEGSGDKSWRIGINQALVDGEEKFKYWTKCAINNQIIHRNKEKIHNINTKNIEINNKKGTVSKPEISEKEKNKRKKQKYNENKKNTDKLNKLANILNGLDANKRLEIGAELNYPILLLKGKYIEQIYHTEKYIHISTSLFSLFMPSNINIAYRSINKENKDGFKFINGDNESFKVNNCIVNTYGFYDKAEIARYLFNLCDPGSSIKFIIYLRLKNIYPEEEDVLEKFLIDAKFGGYDIINTKSDKYNILDININMVKNFYSYLLSDLFINDDDVLYYFLLLLKKRYRKHKYFSEITEEEIKENQMQNIIQLSDYLYTLYLYMYTSYETNNMLLLNIIVNKFIHKIYDYTKLSDILPNIKYTLKSIALKIINLTETELEDKYKNI